MVLVSYRYRITYQLLNLNTKDCFFIAGQLIQWFDWGPSQPSGPDQHCLYIVGGFMGYQWADFHCDFEVILLFNLFCIIMMFSDDFSM